MLSKHEILNFKIILHWLCLICRRKSGVINTKFDSVKLEITLFYFLKKYFGFFSFLYPAQVRLGSDWDPFKGLAISKGKRPILAREHLIDVNICRYMWWHDAREQDLTFIFSMRRMMSSCILRELFSYFGQKCLFGVKVPVRIYMGSNYFLNDTLCLHSTSCPWRVLEGGSYAGCKMAQWPVRACLELCIDVFLLLFSFPVYSHIFYCM